MKIENTKTGIIHKRYKRFLADITFDNGENTTVYVPNTGSMKTCWEPEWNIVTRFIDDPKRKYPYTLEMLHNGKTWIGINTSRTNDLVEEALKNNTIQELKQYPNIQREVKQGKSRLDFLLTNDNEKYYLEVKNVTLKEENYALFPDAVSTRGHKHLEELIVLKKNDINAGLLFVVQREDVAFFNAKNLIDSKYTELLYKAHEVGVDILCYQCCLQKDEIYLNKKLEIVFP